MDENDNDRIRAEIDEIRKQMELQKQKAELQREVDQLRQDMGGSQPKKVPLLTTLLLPMGGLLLVVGIVVFFLFGDVLTGMGLDILAAILIGLYFRVTGAPLPQILQQITAPPAAPAKAKK